jgi:hypothetical protein
VLFFLRPRGREVLCADVRKEFFITLELVLALHTF